ncbi:MAG: hypothetical protein HY762_03830 [Planctomycetes bacterium]|nr:hypothetical protein [Planctomycetota bacterium]
MGNKPPKKCHSEPVGRRISSQTRIKRRFFTEFTLSVSRFFASLIMTVSEGFRMTKGAFRKSSVINVISQ